MRHAGRQLASEGATGSKLLVVISDGFTHDQGYEGGYGEADSVRALDEVRAAGMGCLCLALGGSDDPARLESVFGATAFTAAVDLADIRREIRLLFTLALAGADTRRRYAGLTAP